MRIGELAALAGVSTRTVRHYHHLGLLPEPERRANGYREYGLRDAVALARVRRLAELGLGLDEVRDVMAEDAGRELEEVLAELDADLARQEEAIRARRARLAQVLRQAKEHGGLPSEGLVSAQLAAFFAEMGRIQAALPGPEPAMAAKDRQVLALLESSMDAGQREWVTSLLRQSLATPQAVQRTYEVYELLDELAQAATDDPRVAEAAWALAECLPQDLVQQIGRQGGQAAKAQDAEAGGGFVQALFADFAPAQAEAVRQALRLVMEMQGEKGMGQ